jgi:hypothetical protein
MDEIVQLFNQYKLTKEQKQICIWLKKQGLNTDNETLCFWSKKYSAQRIMDVVRFAQDRSNAAQPIRNIGGFIHKLLITGLAVVNDECKSNREIVEKFIRVNKWLDISIYEKYIKDKITGDDLPLTMPQEDFIRALNALYQKSRLYEGK